MPKAQSTHFDVELPGGRSGAVYRRGKAWWFSYYEGSKRIRVALKPPGKKRATRDKSVARSLALALLQRAARRDAGVEDPFEEHYERPIEEHLQDFEVGGFKTKTGRARRQEVLSSVRSYVEAAKVERLQELNETSAKRWLEAERDRPLPERGEVLSVRSLNKHRAALKQLGRWLARERRVAFDPFVRLDLENQKSDRRYVRGALEPEEIAQLAAAEEVALQYRAIYLLAIGSGLRRGECRALRCGDVDLERGLVIVLARSAKNDKREELPLHGRALELLQEMKAKRLRGEPTRTRKGVGELVQGWEHETRLFDKIPDVDTLKRHLKKVGIDPGTSSPDDGERDVIDFHALRCTLATWCAHENVSLQMAAKLMRHSDPRLTLAVYTRLTEVHKRGAVDRLRLPETVPVTVPGSLHDLAQTRTLGEEGAASERASRPRVADPTSALVDSSATRGLMRAGVRHGLQNRWA